MGREKKEEKEKKDQWQREKKWKREKGTLDKSANLSRILQQIAFKKRLMQLPKICQT